MATPTTNSVPTTNYGTNPTGNAYIDQLAYGVKWGAGGLGTGVTLTYSFPTSAAAFPTSYAEVWSNNAYILNAAQKTLAATTLGIWDNYANIVFVPTADNASNVGELRFTMSDAVDDEDADAYAYMPSNDFRAGDVWLTPYAVYASTTAGQYQSFIFMHEIGHALGLNHTFDTDPLISPFGAQNYFQYSVMSYSVQPGIEMGTLFPDRFPTTPMLYDILALQTIYGANTTFNASNTTYTFDSAGKYFRTIWDAGGTDTIVITGTTGAVIDLTPGSFSQLGQPVRYYNDFTGNVGTGTLLDTDPNTVAIAFGTDIENATGGSGSDTITGNSLNNVLSGGAGNDTLYGDDGNDTLMGGAGADTLNGGDDNDTYYADASDTIVDSSGSDTMASAATYVLPAGNIENVLLTGTAAVNATGNGGANTLTGNGAANTLFGEGGDDTLMGMGGNDTLRGGSGTNTLNGGIGNDTYYIEGNDTLDETGGSGIDTVYSASNYTLPTGFETLRLVEGAGNIDATGNSAANTLVGNSQNNTLTGGLGADTMHGGAGNDTLDGEGGNDTAYGGVGDDTYYVDATTDVVGEGIGQGTDTVRSSVNYTLSVNVENLVLDGSANINGTGNTLNNILTGNTGNNTLNGGTGVDTLNGGDGNDTLMGGAGADTLDGGDGDDTYYADASDTILDSSGSDTMASAATYVLPAGNIENVLLTGTAAVNATGNGDANTLTGNGAANILDGQGGGDTLMGMAGNDTLRGGSGTNILNGGIGNDTYYIEGNDTLVETATGGTDTVYSNSAYTLPDYLEVLRLMEGAGNIDGTGNGAANTLVGNSQNNALYGGLGVDTLYGNAGDDTLDGQGGADKMYGGFGDDTYYVDAATDLVSEAAGQGADTVRSFVSYVLPVNVDNLVLEGSADINGTGNAAVNTLTGNSGKNTLNAGGGADVMTGGGDNDVFRYGATTSGGDTITDFTVGSDVFNFVRAGFGNLAVGTLSAANFTTGTAASDASDRFIFDTVGSVLYYDPDGSAARYAPVTIATLSNGANISNTDIVIVAV